MSVPHETDIIMGLGNAIDQVEFFSKTRLESKRNLLITKSNSYLVKGSGSTYVLFWTKSGDTLLIFYISRLLLHLLSIRI